MQESGPLYITMDACFGLVKKKSASKHILLSRHLYFFDQENVYHFVQSYKYTKASRKVSIACYICFDTINSPQT